MTARQIRAWAWVHKWSSLVCTVFMLLLCLTGLPLIFHHEIGHLLGTEVQAPEMPAGTPAASLDRVVAAARERQPDKTLQFVFREPDDPAIWFLTFGDTALDQQNQRTVAVDARTARVLAEPRFDEGFIYVMFKLHVDLFADLPGKLFLGLMGLLLVVAIVSGTVLYAPFMRKLEFGSVRRERTPRIKWLDLHNLLGVVTLAWAFVVGATGVINTWADLLIKYWQYDQLATLLAPYQGQPVPRQLASLQTAAEAAQALEADKTLAFVAFPGTAFSSPHHYAIFMRGNEPFTARLLKPVLAEAETATIFASVPLPWYLTGLLVSQPLHFGDYGGLPMQILWALLDVLTIVVLGSGLYLWLKRGRPLIAELAPEELLGTGGPGAGPRPAGAGASPTAVRDALSRARR